MTPPTCSSTCAKWRTRPTPSVRVSSPRHRPVVAHPTIAVAFVPEAEPDDEVTEQEGVTAYVAPDVMDVLSEATLDASPADGGAELVIRR